MSARVRQSAVLLGCSLATTYFAYHAVYGRHGLQTRERLVQRSELLDFEIKSLTSVQGKLARDVALLTPELPNADLVEETARDMLGYAMPKDRIIRGR